MASQLPNSIAVLCELVEIWRWSSMREGPLRAEPNHNIEFGGPCYIGWPAVAPCVAVIAVV